MKRATRRGTADVLVTLNPRHMSFTFLKTKRHKTTRTYHVLLRATFSAPTEPATVALVGEEGKDKEVRREHDEWPKTNTFKTKTREVGFDRRQVKHLFTLTPVHLTRRPDGLILDRGVFLDGERRQFWRPRRVFLGVVAVFVEDFVGADDRRAIRETNRPKENVVDSVAAPRRRSVVRVEREFGRNDREWREIRGRETVGDDVF